MSHKVWLKITAVIVASFAPIAFLGTMSPTVAPARLILDFLAWRLGQPSNYDTPDTRLLSALTGGFLLGWGVMIWSLSSSVYDAAPEGVRRTVLASLLAWFTLDSAGSIASGNPSNVAFNVLVLLAAVGPLWRPAKPAAGTSAAVGSAPG
jgi:hypothetical protein